MTAIAHTMFPFRIIRLALLFTFATLVIAASASAQASTPLSFRVETSGGGHPMILIPGLASSGDTWKTTVQRYQGQFECHVLTLAGFAGAPPIANPSLTTVREELVDYIRSRRLERPVIVGHSLGGTLALWLAIEHPELVGPLVIVDSLPFLGGPIFNAPTAAAAKTQLDAMRAGFDNMTEAQIARYEAYTRSGAGTRFLVTSDANHQIVNNWSLASDRKTTFTAMTEVYGLDLQAELGKVHAPTLLLGTWVGLAEQGKQFTANITRGGVRQTFRTQFAALGPLHFALSDTARHFVMLDEPDWMFAEMDAFLKDPAAAVRERGL